MPSKFKKALGAVKDQTSISLAKVSKTATGSLSSHLDLLVLKATTHDEVPVEERHVEELILALTSSTPAGNAAACVQSLSRRIERTRSWVVALKCLHLVFCALRDGGPYFSREAATAMRRGARLLDLSGFRDESDGCSPWDYTAFVRTLALYLNQRLECAVLGKLQNRRPVTGPNRIRDMKPPVILDRIAHWQRLLDRAVATRPTGPAKSNTLVHVSLSLVVQESFDLYRDVSDGLVLILDSFFQLQPGTCARAHQTCVRAAKQFQELSEFYDACKAIGVGRRSEYPEVQKISGKLLEILSEFVRAHAEDAAAGKPRREKSPLAMLPSPVAPQGTEGGPVKEEASAADGAADKAPPPEPAGNVDLLSFDEDDSDARKNEQEQRESAESRGGRPVTDLLSFDDDDDVQDADTSNEKGKSSPITTNLQVLFDVVTGRDPGQPETSISGLGSAMAGNGTIISGLELLMNDPIGFGSDEWELVLAESASEMSSNSHSFSEVVDSVIAMAADSQSHPSSSGLPFQEHNNPFVDGVGGETGGPLAVWMPPVPSPQVSWAGNPGEAVLLQSAMDPFSPPLIMAGPKATEPVIDGGKPIFLRHEQQTWSQLQNKAMQSTDFSSR